MKQNVKAHYKSFVKSSERDKSMIRKSPTNNIEFMENELLDLK